ncbi:MAG: glycoside hydrolase family 43 protein [Clostridium sp.]|nr:glycoside hydrolase family 43 protein [Clostridium sp.]
MKKRIMTWLGVCLLGVMFAMTALAEGETANTSTEDGVTVTIETDKAEYRAGEEIHYTLRVENTKQHWTLAATSFTYSNTDGIIEASEGSAPTELPEIAAGETYELSGVFIGDGEIYVSQGLGSGAVIGIAVGAAAVVIIVIVVVLILLKKKKGSGKHGGGNASQSILVFFLTAALAAGMVPVIPAQAAAADVEEITVRPYIKVQYAGQEIMIRAVINFKASQDLLVIGQEHIQLAQKVTCHDPSIFRDLDGTYYIVGSFLCGAMSQNLTDWTSRDGVIQGNFTEDVKEQIRAWNLDDNAGGWNGYLWAPDVIYNTAMEKYCMYLSANGDNWKSNIVLLTADAFEGPYDYAGTIVYGGFNAEDYAETDAPLVTGENEIPERYVTNGVDNHKWGDMYPNCIDPCVFYDDEGNLWMSYGSWSGGIFMLALDEETGLRDYSVSYETDIHSDAYFGKKIAGGMYVSGEASYIEKIGDYYYLFISYGGLEAARGYNIRVYRSETPDGGYVDALGNDAFFDTYAMNFNMSRGVRLFGGYKWRNFISGQVAQGHNSAFVDEDGRAYIVFHTRTSNGTEGHYVKVHQLFVNKEGWLVAAPYQTVGESLPQNGLSVSQVAGDYEMIIHELEIDYESLETKKPQFVTLTEDGKISGDYTGTWTLEPGTPYITLHFDGVSYSGVTLEMAVENTNIETVVFTAMGIENQVTIWGSRVYE